MNSIIKNAIAVLALSTAITSCSNDHDEKVSGKGNIAIEFDNIFNGADLILNTQDNITSEDEHLKISDVKYIVSNIVLTKEDGTTLTYPKSQSYFIVNEADAASHVLTLENIPAANYTKIKFGIGVDQAQFNLGATGQGNLLAQADTNHMFWSWSAGYKFVLFEGMFTSPTVTTETPYMVHTGQTGTTYNYTEITLSFPDKALVRNTITPEVHIFADVAKIIDGTNKIKLSDNNMGGMGAMIMGGANLPLITDNLASMFSVNHVHND